MSNRWTPDLIRQFRQRLESLRRAGITQIRLPSAEERQARLTSGIGAERKSPPLIVAAQPLDESSDRPTKHVAQRPEPMPQAAAASLFEDSTLHVPALPTPERVSQLAVLTGEVAGCTRCKILATTRTQTVPGEGSPTARLMFIGEAPGADEDRTGRPFVGRAGVLLTDMITKGMGLRREDVYIANILKCRPPDNRTPQADEIAHCLPFLERQIAIIRPEFLCLLGKVAAAALLETTLPMGRLRGVWHRYQNTKTLVTYHPAYLLRNPPAKKDAWEDLKLLMEAMGLPIPRREL